MPGASEEPWGFERQDRSEPSGVERWEYFGRVEELRLLGSFPSRGHGTGMWDAELRGNEAAQRGLAALLVGADEMPVGSLLVQGHTQRNVGMHQGWFVREKRGAGYYAEGGDWDYMVVGSDGRIEKRGKLEHCVRCHAEAEVDYVFTRVMP